MASAAEVSVLAQPVTAICPELGRAWVDVYTTVGFRKVVHTAQEGLDVLADAKREMEARGGKWALKALIFSVEGSRKPARLRLPRVTMVGI